MSVKLYRLRLHFVSAVFKVGERELHRSRKFDSQRIKLEVG